MPYPFGPPPSDPLGMVPGPTPTPIPTPAPPVNVAQDPKQQLLAIATLGAMLGAGPRSGLGAGLGHGLIQGQQDLQHLTDYHAQVVAQQQEHIANQQRLAQQENDRRAGQIAKSIENLQEQGRKAPDQETWMRIATDGATFLSNALGVRGPLATPAGVAQAMGTFIPPEHDPKLVEAWNEWMSNESNKALLESDPSQALLSEVKVKTGKDATGKPTYTTLPLSEVADRSGHPFAMINGKPVVTNKKAATAQFQREKMLVDGRVTDVLVNPNPGAENHIFGLDNKPIDPSRVAAFVPSQASGGSIHDTPNGLVRIGADNSVTPLGVQGYHPPSQNTNPTSDAEAIAGAIMDGLQPPDVKGLYRNAGPVRAALAREGYDLKTANLDWQATQKHLSTLNGQQQLRLRQATETASESLSVIEDLANQWQGGKFPVLNRARLAAAKNGALGPQAQQIATKLEAQITDVASELANVYMGGNSPTDQALRLASKNLNADWTQAQLLSAIDLARKNLKIRLNSMSLIGPVGLSSAPAASTPAATSGDSALDAAAAILRGRR